MKINIDDREGWPDQNNVPSSLNVEGSICKHSNTQFTMKTKKERFLKESVPCIVAERGIYTTTGWSRFLVKVGSLQASPISVQVRKSDSRWVM